ncbi:MAG: dephospho-CoA kinase [Flavobacteriaceae bacterium]
MMLVGLTGGIGSGKSTVASFFRELGIPVYTADDEAKKLMTTSKRIKTKLIKEFGEQTFVDEQLNRGYIASIVFKDAEKLAILNNIVHPEVAKHFKKWASKQNAPYVIQENAILFESNAASRFDTIITVTAPIDLRFERVLKRDDTTIKQIQSRMNNQLSDDERLQRSDFVIENIDLDTTKQQVLDIHNQLLERVKKFKNS